MLLATSFLVALSGCTSIQLALGLRTRLDTVPVNAISASLSPGPGLAPGASARLIIVADTGGGKQLVTVGAGHGDVLFDSFDFTCILARVDEDGTVTIPADPRIADGHTPRIHIVPKGHPDVSADLDIALRYDVAYRADFSGPAGASGLDGLNGTNGMSGSSGSIDLNNPSPGGNGTDGSDGGNGGDGSAGGAGEAVHVWLTLAPVREPGSSPRLQARVSNGSRDLFFLIDAAGGTLAVTTNGGPGGSGGRGGRGGAGGSGSPSGMPGYDGLNGRDGWAGAPGAAGTILVFVDPHADIYIDRLRLSNKDGASRQGPARVVRVEPVPPLW